MYKKKGMIMGKGKKEKLVKLVKLKKRLICKI